jgi:hypothetical protein
MDKNTIKEASALFVIEEVEKLLDKAEQVNSNLEKNLERTDTIYAEFSEKQSIMLSKVASKLEQNANNGIVQNKNKPGAKLLLVISATLIIGIAIGYFVAKNQ